MKRGEKGTWTFRGRGPEDPAQAKLTFSRLRMVAALTGHPPRVFTGHLDSGRHGCLDVQQHVGRPHHRGEPLRRVIWSAALFLAGRVLQPQGPAELDTAWTASLLVALFAALVVAGVVALPAARAALAAKAKLSAWVRDALWAAGLALAGFGAIVAALAGGVSVTEVVAAPAAETVNGVVLGVAVAVVLGSPIVGIPALASHWVGRVLTMPWGGWLALPLAAGSALAVGVLSVGWVWDGLSGSWWQVAGALLALAAGPALAVRLFLVR